MTNDISIAELNAGVRKIGLEMLGGTLDNIVAQGVIDTGNLFKKARMKLLYDYNEVEVISLIMPRYGFVQETESGLGSTAAGGDQLRGGVPRPTIHPAVENRMEQLADYVAEVIANRGVDGVRIGIRVK